MPLTPDGTFLSELPVEVPRCPLQLDGLAALLDGLAPKVVDGIAGIDAHERSERGPCSTAPEGDTDRPRSALWPSVLRSRGLKGNISQPICTLLRAVPLAGRVAAEDQARPGRGAGPSGPAIDQELEVGHG